MEPSNQLELEQFNFISMILHTIGHRITDLRSRTQMLRQHAAVRGNREIFEEVESLHEVAHELAADLNWMRLFTSDTRPVSCDFLTGVIQPSISFPSRVRHSLRLIVDRSIRKAPQVKLCPSLVRQALVGIFIETGPHEVTCRATGDKKYVTFYLNLRPVNEPLADDVQERLTCLLNAAGVRVEEFSHDNNTYRFRLKAEAAQTT